MHSVCPCSLPVWRRSFLKKGTPVTYFCTALDPPLGGSGRKTTTFNGPWVPHPYQVSSKPIKRLWGRSWKCKKFTPDGRTDDGRCAMTIAHSSLRLRWTKKCGKQADGDPNGESDGRTHGDRDGHHHTIIRPVWRRAYKNEEIINSLLIFI